MIYDSLLEVTAEIYSCKNNTGKKEAKKCMTGKA